MATETKHHETFSLRVAACRYTAVLRTAEAGLSTEADVARAWHDLERAAVAHAAAKERTSNMKRLITIAVACGGVAALLLCAGCGGASAGELSAAPVDVTAPIPPGAQRVVTEAEASAMSGLDCSVNPCPAAANLQCLSVAGKRECFYVLAPTDGCLGVKVDRTSTGETTPVICAAQCGSSDLPGAPTCPNGLACSNDAARVCFH